MMPQATDLKYFLTVCESKNISRASELLGISQPSLSLAIKRLENIAGVRLLVRTKAGVDLTHEGAAFRVRAEELLDLWQAISHDIKKSSDEVGGRYVFGAHMSVALVGLVSAISNLMAAHPALEISVTHGWSRNITDQIISFDIDFALVVNPVSHPDLVINEICQDQVGFFVQREKFDKNVLIYDPNLLQSQALLKAIKEHGLIFKRTITSSSLEFIGRLAQLGVGVGLLPARAVTYLSEPQLTLWDEDLPRFHDRHCLIYRADAQKTKSARMLATSLKELLVASLQVQG